VHCRQMGPVAGAEIRPAMTAPENEQDRATVGVIGGGLAGMAAALAAAQSGLRVELFEARRTLGGRAGSFRDPASGQRVDLCQHVAMGCCTNLIDFFDRAGIEPCFVRQPRLHFIGPDGSQHDLTATPLLPAPLHLMPWLFRLGYLSRADRWRIVRTLTRLASARTVDDQQTIGSWLRRQGESDRAMERFWSVVLVSALSETLDRASLAAARKVFVDGFLASRRAYELVVPRAPLEEIFDGRAGARLARLGVTVHRGARVRYVEGDAQGTDAVVLADGSKRRFDFVVLAVPWRNVRGLLPQAMLDALLGLERVEQIQPAPITAVHLWLDRPITALPNAVLIGRLSQWVFRPAWAVDPTGPGDRGYCQVVISASHGLVGRDRQEVARQVWEELRAIWPAAGQARLIRWRVIRSPGAVFSVCPGLDALRPAQSTPIGNLTLAGDWTATGWPATMEGAVRSGYLAVEAILQALGRPKRILVPDLPQGRLARRRGREGL